MRNKLIYLGVRSDRIAVAENWADAATFNFRSQNHLSEELTIVYPGNLGLGHDVDTLLGALELLQDVDKLKFVFVGGGEGLDEVRSLCSRRNIRICAFLPYEDPLSLARERLSRAHIGLVTQK